MTIAKTARARAAPWAFGLVAPFAFGKRGGLACLLPFEAVVFRLELPNLSAQFGHLALEGDDQFDEVSAAQIVDRFGGIHSGHCIPLTYRTQAANQLRCL
jgi:hypothetical protein